MNVRTLIHFNCLWSRLRLFIN